MTNNDKFNEVKQVLLQNLPNTDIETILKLLQEYNTTLEMLKLKTKQINEIIAIVEKEKQKRVN